MYNVNLKLNQCKIDFITDNSLFNSSEIWQHLDLKAAEQELSLYLYASDFFHFQLSVVFKVQ